MPNDFSRRQFTALGLGGLASAAPGARAQTPQAWPQRTVKFIIPFGAGAGADIGARLIADKLGQRWNRSVIVENRPGGDGIVAVSAFMNANDDHILMFAAAGSFTVHPYQIENLRYVFERDLLPIARYSSTIIAVAVPEASGVKSMKDLVERARANPGKLNAALVPGLTELIWDGFVKTEGLEITKVPYKDIVPAAGDLAESRIDVLVASYAIIRPIGETGKIRTIAVTSPERVPILPEVPSVFEAGYPSLGFDGLVGLFGPKIMPAELRGRIGADVVAAALDPVIGQRLATTGQLINPGGAAEFEASIKKQMDQVAGVAKQIGMERK